MVSMDRFEDCRIFIVLDLVSGVRDSFCYCKVPIGVVEVSDFWIGPGGDFHTRLFRQSQDDALI